MKGTEQNLSEYDVIGDRVMKVKTFLNKFMFASSSIKYVFIYDTFGHAIILTDSMIKECDYREELNSIIETFQVNNDRLIIYCK